VKLKLAPHLQRFVDELIRSGEYAGVDDVIVHALEVSALVGVPRTIEDLVAESERSIEEFGTIELTPEYWEYLKQRQIDPEDEYWPTPWYISGEDPP
jgi:hypothetical protein